MDVIFFTKKSIFSSKCEVYVNPVNCIGIMGKGLVLQFRYKFPENYIRYKEYCDINGLYPGNIFVTRTNLVYPKFIFNFPTKRRWEEKSELMFIENGMSDLELKILKNGIKSIAFPKLGCGSGGLDWNKVYPIILRELTRFSNLSVEIYL